jgi:predicted DNA-binding ribbon-helix-helix protein
MQKLDLERKSSRGMESHIEKRTIVIAGSKKRISLEPVVWKSLKEIAAYQGTTLLALVASIDSNRNGGNLSSAARLFVLDFYHEQLDLQNRRRATDSALHCAIRGLH